MLSIVPLLLIAVSGGLIIFGGVLVCKRGNPDTVEQRYFLFLIWTAIGLLATVLIYWLFPHPGYGFVIAFVPIIPAVIAISLLHLHEWHTLNKRRKIPISSAVILMALLASAKLGFGNTPDYGRQLEAILQVILVLSASAFLFIFWKLGGRYSLLFGVAALLYLTIFNGLEVASFPLPFESFPGSLASTTILALAYLAIPGLVVSTTALLISNDLKSFPGSEDSNVISWWPIIGRIVPALILLGYLVYTYVWLWIWDGTDDGVRWFLMIMTTVTMVASTGMMIGMTSSGWHRWIGLPYAILVMALIYGTGIGIGNRFSNYSVTEARAAHIQNALESYHAKTGWYPFQLAELAPAELLHVPLPMIIPGQKWCYEGGSNYYRLGAVYREHWSSPYLSIRVYASAGNAPEGTWGCDERLTEVQTQFETANAAPTPVPLPTSVASIPRIAVEPILRTSKPFSVGNWSPDGAYLVFGMTEYFMDKVERVRIDLRFLEAKTGNICRPSKSEWTVKESDGLLEHSAWLPDGRFLYVTDVGEMVAFQPCADGMEDLANRYPVTFTHAVAFNEQSGRVLLKNRESYWLLDGNSLEVQEIAGIPAHPSEIYRAWYDWSQNGRRLAISSLMGPEESDEAFLFIVDTETGEVKQNLPLSDASDANLPIVEWLTDDELLMHGSSLTVLDFRSDPPGMTDLIHDVFLLDIEYPIDISSMDSLPDLLGNGYTIGVRVNHPHNQGIYLYESKTGQVKVFQHDTDSLFIFPDGRWMSLPKWEDEPTYTDEYEIVWMDTNEVERLVVEGHVPRNHSQIFPKYSPNSSQLIFNSSQGISLVSIPDGGKTHFWKLTGNGAAHAQIYPSLSEEALIVVGNGVGLYYIPLRSN